MMEHGWGIITEADIDNADQDHADGRALRRLREALPARTVFDLFYIPEWRAREDGEPPYTVKVWGAGLDPGVSKYGHGPTIAEAADECREALSATLPSQDKSGWGL